MGARLVILGLIIAIIVVVTAIVVTATQLKKAKKSADKNFSNKCVGSSSEPCSLADLTVVVKNPNTDSSINFKNEIFVEHTGETTLSQHKKCDQNHTFGKLKAGAYRVSAKPAGDSGFHFETPIDITLAESDKKTVTLELKPLAIEQVTPTADGEQYVNLDADPAKPELGRVHKIQAKINKKQKDVTVYFELAPDAKNNKSLDAKLEAKIAKSAKTNDEGIAELDFTLSRFGGDKFAVKACLTPDFKHPSASVVSSKEITVWRRLWYQLNHHKDIVPPSMTTAVSKIKDVFIDFIAETPIKHTKAAKGKVLVGSHNASTYHALRASAHNDRSVHIILCDTQIDGTPGLSNEVEVEFDKNNDYILATEKTGKTYVMVDPPLQAGKKLFISGSWKNTHTGKSGTLSYDATKTTDSIGLVKPNNEHYTQNHWNCMAAE